MLLRNISELTSSQVLGGIANTLGSLPSFFSSRHIEEDPVTLTQWPSYPWPGNSENGSWLLSGLAQYPGGMKSAINAFWEPLDAPGRHCFTWLSDLRAAGGDQARQTARLLIASWVEKHSNKQAKPVWDINCVGKRLSSLILFYDFHGSSGTDSYQKIIGKLITTHAAYLNKNLVLARASRDTLEASCALILAALCIPGKDQWLSTGEDILIRNLKAQILPDGGHASRSPERLASVLRSMLDVRRMYKQTELTYPDYISDCIKRMGQALEFFRYTDKSLALFHSSQKGHDKVLDLIAHQAGASKTSLRTLSDMGFERLSQGRTVILFDTGQMPVWPHDTLSSAAPLAFEMAYGKERMIVNCGAHPLSPEWNVALRGTAAHSTVTLDRKNAAEIRDDGHLGRKPRQISSSRDEKKNSILVEASHNGYQTINGLTHKRRLYLAQRGQDLRGEDILSGESPPLEAIDYAVRFHLHPRVKVLLVRDETEALLTLPSGTGWRFQQEGGILSLEESIYLDEGYQPVKTSQIVISGKAKDENTIIKWALQREGV